jgi:hypothetical protein
MCYIWLCDVHRKMLTVVIGWESAVNIVLTTFPVGFWAVLKKTEFINFWNGSAGFSALAS